MPDKARRPRPAAPPSLVGTLVQQNPDRCLMEIVSRMAGEAWTDHPTCVHPALGAIARGVFDHTSDDGKAALLPLAPTLIGTTTVGLEMPARLVATCVSTALASPVPERITAEESARLQAGRRTALYLLRRCPSEDTAAEAACDGAGAPRRLTRWWVRGVDLVGLTEPVYRRLVSPEVAAEAVAVTARASGAQRDQRLRQLLRWCIALTDRLESADGTTGGEPPRAPHD